MMRFHMNQILRSSISANRSRMKRQVRSRDARLSISRT